MTKAIQLIGLPYLMGRRAPGFDNQMAEGPEILLGEKSLPSRLGEAGYDVQTQLLTGHDDPSPDDTGGDFRLLPKGDQMSRVLVQVSALARAVTDALELGRFPLVAGGTCSSALGVVGGISAALDEPVGLIWFDAHADAHTPDTSPNGFIEGMLVSTIAGQCWPLWRRQIPGFREIPEERIVTVGLHEQYAPGGRPAEWHGGAVGHLVDPPAIEKMGFSHAVRDAHERLTAAGVSKVYVHFDTDVIDQNEFAANRHSAVGGISIEQAHAALTQIGSDFQIIAANFCAWDPSVDANGQEIVESLCQTATEAALPKQ